MNMCGNLWFLEEKKNVWRSTPKLNPLKQVILKQINEIVQIHTTNFLKRKKQIAILDGKA